MENLIKRTYALPEDRYMPDSTTVNVTQKQADALDRIAKRRMFDAYFWAEKVVWLNNNDKTEDGGKVIRFEGTHYTIGDDDSSLKGFSGRHFVITLNNGETIETTNLWHQGDIPEELNSILIDNAISIKNM